MTTTDYYVIHYRVADGPWKHGRSIEPFVFADKAVLRGQRRYTVDAAREAEGGVAERITTRVLTAEEGQRRLDEQEAQERRETERLAGLPGEEEYPPHLLEWALSLNEPTRHLAVQRYVAYQTAAADTLHSANQHLAALQEAKRLRRHTWCPARDQEGAPCPTGTHGPLPVSES